MDIQTIRRSRPWEPISIGFYAENGRALYIEFSDILLYDMDMSATEALKGLINPSVELNSIVCRDFEDKPCKSIREAKTSMIFKTTKRSCNEYIRTWLESFDEHIEFWSFAASEPWCTFVSLMGGVPELPKFICPYPYDLVTLMKVSGINPEEVAIEDIAKYPLKRYTAVNLATMYFHAYTNLSTR